MFNIQSIFRTAKEHYILILILSLDYASMLMFPAFGPVLNRVLDEKTALIISSWSIFCLAITFLIRPMKFENKPNYLIILSIAASVPTLFFTFLPLTVKWAAVLIFSVAVGRIAIFWSRIFLESIGKQHRGKVISLVLFLSYGILYIGNVTVPSLPRPVSTVIPIILIISSAVLKKLHYKKPVKSVSFQESSEKDKSHPIWMFFVIIGAVYITAGITYSSVYPQFSIYPQLERYYNVLPFVLLVPFAGIIADIKGRKSLLYVGLSFLGLSFVFFTLKDSPCTHLLTQTMLQPGWAFLNSFVWIAAADLAAERNKPYLQVYGVTAFLAGTNIGSVISILLINTELTHSPYFSLLTYFPLFIVVALIQFIPETLTKVERSFNDCLANFHFCDQLTPREKEIMELLFYNLGNSEICSKLFITTNTLKTHTRNIYRKAGVSSKKELKEYFGHQNNVL